MSKKKEPYRPKPLTDSKREFISKFITEFNLHSTEDIQNALRDPLRWTGFFGQLKGLYRRRSWASFQPPAGGWKEEMSWISCSSYRSFSCNSKSLVPAKNTSAGLR